MISDRLIVALDYQNIDDARALVRLLGDTVSFYKVGMELAYDLDGIRFVQELKQSGKKVFLDLKLHDIPTTVERSVRKLARLGVDMLSIHGYPDVVAAAAVGKADSDIQLFGISVLTSMDEAKLVSAGYYGSMRAIIGQRTDYAVIAGITGLVCAVSDISLIRNWSGGTLKTISPGIRMPNQANDDQIRIATPKKAIESGADYIVVGRAITGDNDPKRAVERVLENAASGIK